MFRILGLDLGPDQISKYTDIALHYAFLIAAAIVIWIVGSRVASWVSKRAQSAVLSSTQGDEAVAGFAQSLVRWLALAIVAIAILNLFGIEATSLVAILGAATLAVGLALQGTMANFASGVMLLIFRPFKIGHFVEVAGHSGTVKKIALFATELATADNVQIIIPNSEAWSTSIVNYSAHDRRRVDIVFGVDYGADMDVAIQTIKNVIDADPRASHEPAPFVKVTNLGDSSVDITMRVWCQAADYWDLKFELTKRAKESLDKAGISIPYPHMEVIQKPAS